MLPTGVKSQLKLLGSLFGQRSMCGLISAIFVGHSSYMVEPIPVCEVAAGDQPASISDPTPVRSASYM